MRVLLYLSVVIMFFISCSKKVEIENEKKEYPIKFEAIGFSQQSLKSELSKEVGNLEKAANLISHLYFVIFDAQGNMFRKIEQDTSKNVNFGSVDFSLPEGSYKIAVVGASQAYAPNENKYEIDFDNIDQFSIFFRFLDPNNPSIRHTFCSELFPFEVSGNTTITKELLLKRVTSQLDIVFENKIPDDAGFVNIEIPSIEKYNFFSDNRDNYGYTHKIILSGMNGESGARFSIPIFYGNESANSAKLLKITMYDKSNAVIVSRYLSNIRFEKNKITEIKGNIFADPKVPFGVSISSSFDGQIDFTF